MNIADLNVLVVEDDDFQRNILVTILNSLGVTKVIEAGNGRKALDIVRGNTETPMPHVALCDLNMPEMDGMEFLRHLGKERKNIAVILTSSLDGKLLASVGRMTSMYGIPLLGTMEKPVLLSTLKDVLAKYDATPLRPAPTSGKDFSLDEILLGIEQDQFEPYFQPKVDLESGRLVGAEALARWVHPEHGVIGPYSFIPQLEQTGNIDELTFHILRKSAAACRVFHAKGQLLTLSVNLSLVSLDDTTLADKITRTVREAGVDPQYIVLEITESAAMTNVAPALENLARLCMNGFALSIDDYGTGSSNLQQLTRIAFSELKIDQSFVKDFADNNALRIVVESSIDMAHKLQVKSVAEGVENLQDWNALKSVGCDTVQGYYIAQPMDLVKFDDFVASYKQKFSALLSPSPISAQKQVQHKILVVEDDEFTRKIILRVLQDFGYTSIHDVESAPAAIRLFETHTFDLILTDINMPGMSGLKFIQMIRAGKTLAKPETRIVVLTGFSQTEILGTALALDVNGFLVKPVIPAVVEEKLAQAMSERLHLHSPVAYEAVKTDANGVPGFETPVSRPTDGVKVNQGISRTPGNKRETKAGNSLPLSRLRPGMILKEPIRLKDGTLILSPGHTLSETSINRLHDLRALLSENEITVQ